MQLYDEWQFNDEQSTISWTPAALTMMVSSAFDPLERAAAFDLEKIIFLSFTSSVKMFIWYSKY